MLNYFRDILMIKGKNPGGGGWSNFQGNSWKSDSLCLCQLGVIGEIACVTPAWSYQGHSLN